MKKLLVIDGNALVHRGYHALPELTSPDGRLVNGVYGFFLVFLKAVSGLNPDYICACFDRPEPTFRHKKFKGYKAQRPKTPDNLAEQIPVVKSMLKAMGVPIYEKAGYEADDIIATIVAKIGWTKNRTNRSKQSIIRIGPMEIVIVTGDLDALQLVRPGVKVYMLGRGMKKTILYNEQKVRDRYGLSPVLLADYRGLKGDASDNIPGVPGIGPKTATKLLKEFGSLEGIYEAAEGGESGIKEGVKKLLQENKGQAFLSKELAEMRKDAPIKPNLKDCAFQGYDKAKTEAILKELGFKTLISRLPASMRGEPGNRRRQMSLI